MIIFVCSLQVYLPIQIFQDKRKENARPLQKCRYADNMTGRVLIILPSSFTIEMSWTYLLLFTVTSVIIQSFPSLSTDLRDLNF